MVHPPKKQNRAHVTPSPVYHQIKTDICLRIRRGEWPVGTKVPARSILATEYGVALNTLQHAIAELIDEGVLQAENKRGTFIASVPEIPAIADNTSVSPSYPGLPAPPPLDSESSPTIGIIGVNELAFGPQPAGVTPWVITVMQALEQQFANVGGRSKVYVMADGSVAALEESLAAAIREGVDALAIINVDDYPGWTPTILSMIDPNHPPTMYISWDDIQAPFPHIFYDQQYAGMVAAQHLLQSGYAQLAFYTPFQTKWLEERIEGVRHALRLAGQADDSLLRYPLNSPNVFTEVTAQLSVADVVPSIDFLLRQFDPTIPCGILCPNDIIAALACKAIEQLGYVVGQQVGIVGFDDMPMARLHDISSMRPPMLELGEAAANALARALGGERLPLQTRLCSNLIPRNSSNCSAATSRRVTISA